ncbi:peptide/nickel transport system permease protein [Curtobacterium sp. PhB130]|uniref:ABC transporter permease n=1 Tax=unclassified Curtobacterium TaxID=257496 RepID=UPI000F4B46F8|nr:MULTISPECIES: ABC transporter permease [unclassified Curtobacterium]ROS71856.1 peptide/nickel transport system permease protein [Curtobacterium sp. PhB130]TCK58250.1 peptide/nickel transport system permease protein [Curtobacterium sp. PhB136]
MQILRKLGFYLVAFWAAITLNFAIPRLLPGNPVDALLAKLSRQGPVAPGTRKALQALFGSNSHESLWQQYGDYLGQLAHGNLGISVTYYPTPVVDIIAQAIPWTLVLVGLSTCITFAIGIALGTFAGWKRGTWVDSIIPATTLMQSIPYFWLALVLVYVFSLALGWFPINGGYDVNTVVPGFSWSFISSAIVFGTLPALTIVLSSIGGWLLGMRNMMVSTLSEDYVVTAEAKGLHPMRVMITYAARNAVLPSVAGFAISLGFVVAGSIVTEQVFSYPGIGNRMLDAVGNNDYSLMQGLFLIITIAVLAANLIVDILYGIIDPRTRARA